VSLYVVLIKELSGGPRNCIPYRNPSRTVLKDCALYRLKVDES